MTKGIFIPDITVEMIRKASLEAIETLLVEGEMYDVDMPKMKWINAEQQVTVTIYDEEHEEHLVKTMTVEEMLDSYTNEGCPTMYSNPEQKGKWIPVDSFSAFGGDEAMWMAHGNPVVFYYCSECKEQAYAGEDGESLLTDFCPFCGADMRTEGNDDN